MKYTNPEIPEGINTSETKPLKEFAFLTSAMLAIVILLTTVLALSIDWAAQYIPFSLEVSIAQPIEKKLGGESNEVDDYLQTLVDKISVKMHLPEEMKIRVHYVNDDTVNAMATLGGHVLIYRGLLEKLPNENSLLMLLGHEIAHVKLRHPVKALGKGVILSLLMQVILGQTSDAAVNVLSESSMITMLSFSRNQEQAADEEGLQLVNAFYGHTRGATDLFDVLKSEREKSSSNLPQMLSTHPDTDNRIDFLKQLSISKQWLGQGRTKQIPAYIKAKIAKDKHLLQQKVEPEKEVKK